jgi:hypothetical protein
MGELFNAYLLALAAAGIIAGLGQRRWRRETLLLLLWLAVGYAFFSYLEAKESRYVLLLSVPVVCLAAQAVVMGVRAAGAWAKVIPPTVLRAAVPAALAVVLAAQAWLAGQVQVESVAGFREAVHFLEQVAPAEPVFYDGWGRNVLTYYVLAGDADYQRQVVLGNKLLYAAAPYPRLSLREFVSSPAEVVEVLRKRGGCRWLVIARQGRDEPVAAARHLRAAVAGPEFELVKSFPVASGIDRLDVYHFRLPVEPTEEVDLPLPVLGADTHYRVKPIPPRGAAGAADH